MTNYLSIYLYPALVIIIGYLCARYFYQRDSDSRVMNPDWLPLKQPIMVNNETISGQIPVDEILQYFPDYENSFDPVYSPVNRSDPNYYQYRMDVYRYSGVEEGTEPFNMGNYLFYKMDRENHDYQMMTFFNSSSYQSMLLFP